MRVVLQIAQGAAIVTGLIAVQVAALYALWWGVLVTVRIVPMIGRRHRHRDWDRLNR